MKNLKLFVAPILGAALMTACGAKPMDVKDFRQKVQEKFNLNTIQQDYVGLKQHTTGYDGTKDVEYSHVISGINSNPIASGSTKLCHQFTFVDLSSTGYYDILDTEVVDDVYENMKNNNMTVNYFISGDTYTVEASGEMQGIKSSSKYVYNKDLVMTRVEANMSGQGQSRNMHLDFKYEK